MVLFSQYSHKITEIKERPPKHLLLLTSIHWKWMKKTKFCNFFELEHSWFSVKFAKFLRTPVFTEHHQWLLLKNGLQRKSEISPVYMTKVTRLQRKKSGKERMTWDGECLRLRQNYKGNLDLLKRCSEKFLQWLFLEKRLFFNLS